MSDSKQPVIRFRHALLLGLVVVLSAFALRAFTEAFAVPSSSMEPTLIPGDHVLVTRYLIGRPKLRDVVVFVDASDHAVIKRVIGLPGDSVEVSGGHVVVNGESLEETYTATSNTSGVSVHVVPSGHLFLLGDNRDASADSRTFGFVREDAIVGRARFIYWSSTPSGNGPDLRWSRLFRVVR